MTKLLIVADSLMAGGIESQMVELVLHLRAADYDPEILCLYGPTARDLHFAQTLRYADIPLHLPDLGWSASEKARGIREIIAVTRKVHPALIQAEGYHANLLLRLARPFLGRVKVLGTVRGVPTAKQLLYDRAGAWLNDHIAVNAPHLRDILLQQGHISARKVTYIPNGIDVQRFTHPPNHLLRQQIAPGAERVLLSLGRISFEKNMHWIAEAVGLLRVQGRLPVGARLIIAGDVHHPEAEELLQSSIATHGLSEVVSVLPQTADTPSLYHASDVTVLVSPHEGLPNVVLESLAAGKPVIISAGANAAGVISDDVTGWVTPTGDVKALAERLSAVLTMPVEALHAMKPACLTRAEQFSVERMVERYVALYAKMLAK